MAKVNANTLRAGQVIELDGKLYAVLKAENIIPGKGNAVTAVELRRLSDGIKTVERFRTQESVERAFIDEEDFQYLFSEGAVHTFMNQESFEQLEVPSDVLGEDQARFLQDGMIVTLKLFEGQAVSGELPQKVTLEIAETEPVVKGQTASSSYKPAILSNGVRTMVPPHIDAGTRVVVMTDDASYVERAKA
ncbi:MAG: elongation factor P [Pseudomonadota bacterium]